MPPLPEGRGKLAGLLGQDGAAQARIRELEGQLAAIGELVQEHAACDRDCGGLARGVLELLRAEPDRPAQAGTDIPVDAAYEDQTMPESRPNTRTSE